MYNSQTYEDKLRNFKKWAAATDAALGPFNEAIGKTPIANQSPPIQTMKKQASIMSDCLRDNNCLNGFVKHTIAAKKEKDGQAQDE